MTNKTFKMTDDSELAVAILEESITFTVYRSYRREACIDWNFDSADDMKAQMAAMVEQSIARVWGWDNDRAALGGVHDIYPRPTSPVGRLAIYGEHDRLFSDLKLWLREQFQVPKLKPESEQLIDDRVRRGYYLDVQEMREFVLQIVAIEKGEG